jgi:hypothetical protein
MKYEFYFNDHLVKGVYTPIMLEELHEVSGYILADTRTEEVIYSISINGEIFVTRFIDYALDFLAKCDEVDRVNNERDMVVAFREFNDWKEAYEFAFKYKNLIEATIAHEMEVCKSFEK